MLRSFRAVGAANSVLALWDEAGIPLAETQKDLTPFQRMVLMEEIQEKRERENEAADGGGGGGGGRRNALANTKTDGVTYTNDHAD